MHKKWISILLVLAMVCSLLPMSVFAEETDAAPVGDQKVAVMVYGKVISDIVNDPTVDLETLAQRLKSAAQDVLAGAKIPDVDMVLISDEGYEYPLVKDGVDGATFLTSFNFEATGGLSLGAKVFKIVQDVFGQMFSDFEISNEFYKIYGAVNVPEGDYTLQVRHIYGDGYILWAPESGSIRVHVGTDGMNYVGFDKELGSFDPKDELYKVAERIKTGSSEKIKEILTASEFLVNAMVEGVNFLIPLLNELVPDWDQLLKLPAIRFSMPGIFLNTVEPGFAFKSADLGGNPLPGTEFVMVNREETEKIVKASIALGKDTFENAMALVGTEGFTWDELNILNQDIIAVDQEAQQISFNPEQAYKLLQTYWALFEASAREPFRTFMSAETDLRLPAILKSTADENGVVRFTEKNNVTLTWSIEILFKMAGLANEVLQDAEIPEGLFENESLQALMELMLTVSKISAAYGDKLIDEYGNVITDTVNDWIYPILMNDDLASFARDLLLRFSSEPLSEKQLSMIDLLPTHAILTAKMPAGHYIMFESAAPEGYVRSPLFYTIIVEWNTDDVDVRNWCYVNVANLGVVAPYFAEELYSVVRNTSLAAEADKLLNSLTGGKTGTLLQNIFTGKDAATGEDFDLTAIAIAYQASLIYNNMGGNKVYASEDALIEALNTYLYSHGRTAQNLLMFGAEVAAKAKSVVTSEITPDWTFYTASTSLRTNIALKAKAIGERVAESIDTSNGNKVLTAAKETITSVVSKIDTSNKIQPILNQLQEKIRETAAKLITNVLKSSFSFFKNAFLKLWNLSHP